MKRGWRVVLILLACAAVAGIVALAWPARKEPSYRGKRLSEWMEEGYFNYREDREAMEAIRHMGTNALPCLLEAIAYQHSASRQRVIQVANMVPIALGRFLRLYNLAEGQGERRAEIADFGFKALGPDAGPAVPELTRLMEHTNDLISDRAMHALAWIGRDGVEPLAAVLRDKQHANRSTAASCVSDLCHHDATNASSAMPVMLECIGDKDPVVVMHATVALGYLAIEPGVCVPALAQLTYSTNAALRKAATRSLARFGKDAQPAVPSLVECLRDPDPDVREAATNALRRIAPEALTNGMATGVEH